MLVAALLAAALTASLGFWQLRRADYKESLQAAMDRQMTMVPVHNDDIRVLTDLASVLHRQAEVEGEWVPAATVFLDNRQMEGRQGFYVLTPLKLSNDGRWLWIQRGWVPRDFTNRTRVPDVPTPGGQIRVSGRLSAAPSKVYALGADDEGPIRQNLDIAAAASELQAPFIDGCLIQLLPPYLSPDDGLERHWPPVAVDVHKHYGYAFQWFGLCALIVFLYVWFQIVSPRRRSGS